MSVVCIDAGHGGKDPGAVGKKGYEKDIALSMALKLGQMIENEYKDVKVVYTRTTDVFIPLHERAAIANENKAHLFISIHINASENKKASGTSTHVLGLHRANENFEVAKRENSVILYEDDYNTKYEGFDPNSPESLIVFSLMQNLFLSQSIDFASLVQRYQKDFAERVDRGVHQNGFLVLARTSMPAVLVETGFISNAEEEAFLVSDTGQEKIASSIFNAFVEYKKIIDNKSVFNRTSGSVISSNSNDVESAAEGKNETKIIEFPRKEIEQVGNQIVFKVQIIVSGNRIPLDSDIFKDLTAVQEFRVGAYYKYATGDALTEKQARKYHEKIKERFPGSFIVAVKDNVVVPLSEVNK